MSKHEKKRGRKHPSVILTFGPQGGSDVNLYNSQVISLTADIHVSGTSINFDQCTVDFNIDPPDASTIMVGIQALYPQDAHAYGKKVPVESHDSQHARAELPGVVISKAGKDIITLTGTSHNPSPTSTTDQIYNVLPTITVLNSSITGVFDTPKQDGNPSDPKTCFGPLAYYIGAQTEGMPTEIDQQMVSTLFFTHINADPSNPGVIQSEAFDYFNFLDEKGNPVSFIDDSNGGKRYLSEANAGTFSPIYLCPKQGLQTAVSLYIQASDELVQAGDLIVADLKNIDISLLQPKILNIEGGTLQIPPDTTLIGATISRSNSFTVGGSIYLLVNGVVAYYFQITDLSSQFPGGFLPNVWFPENLLRTSTRPNDPSAWNQVSYIYADTRGKIYISSSLGFYAQSFE